VSRSVIDIQLVVRVYDYPS